MALTAKMIKFCQEYLIDYNATQAAIRSGYSEHTAGSQAHDLLKKPEIQEYLEQLKEEDAAAAGITRNRILQEWARLAFFDIRGIYGVDGQLRPIGDLTADQAAAIAGIESYEEKTGEEDVEVFGTVRKVKIIDKTKALEALSKHRGLLVDKVDITSNGETLNVQVFQLPDNNRQNNGDVPTT